MAIVAGLAVVGVLAAVSALPRPRPFSAAGPTTSPTATGSRAGSQTSAAGTGTPPPHQVAVARGLAPTPPMGWDGYNRFARGVTAAMVEAEARALVQSGMAVAGYRYVILDGGWNLPSRNAQGELQPDPSLFPQGIAPVAAYVHSLGLKFGIYASAGIENCAGTSAGSYGYYQQDADTFAAWGVDYVKLDWCRIPFAAYPTMTHRQVSQMLAGEMSAALAATGRPILFDLNDTNPGADSTWTWASQVAEMWRTVPDIRDSYASMVWNFTHTVPYYAYAGPGGWNDPDDLEVGNPGLSSTAAQSQFSLWAEVAAPLIAGTDLTTMSASTRSILTNRAVITVDQDPLGDPGHVVWSSAGHWVLTRLLTAGDRAVVLFNQTSTAATISTNASLVGLGRAARYTLDDLWTGQVTSSDGAISALVPAHGVVMYRVATA